MAKIKITLPDKTVKELEKGITPLKIAESIGKRLAKDSIAAKVDNELWDIDKIGRASCRERV